MTPRLLASAKVRLAAVIFLGGVSLIAMVGCDPRALAYFLQPFEPMIEPPYKGSFQGKKVVVLCHVMSDATGEFPSLEHDLSREFCSILRTKVKKINVVDSDKVATWVEAHPTSTDPADVANDFSADIVIDLEVEQFRLQAPGDLNLLHGESKVHIKAFEMKYPKNSKDKELKDQPKEADNIYDDYAETTFPNRGHLPIDSGQSRSKFQRTFLRIVAKELSWHFVEHAQDDVIQNSRIEN
jgi:hypothetical protein